MEPQFIDDRASGPTPPSQAEGPQYDQKLADLEGKIAGVEKSIGQISGMFEQMLGHVTKPQETPEKDEKQTSPQWPADEELEAMSRKEAFGLFAQNILGEIENKLGKPLKEQIEGLNKSLNSQRGQTALERAEQKYPDLHEWEDELSKVLQTMTEPNIDRAMLIVKGENPDKAKQVAQKYEQKPEPTEEESLLSLIPSRPGEKAGQKAFGDLSLTDAAQASFQQFGQGILQAQEEHEKSALMSMPQ